MTFIAKHKKYIASQNSENSTEDKFQNDKKYFFVYNENNSGELMLYDEAMQKSLLTCSFNTLSAGFNKTKSLLDTKFPSLLMALCWYVFQPQGVIVTETAA